AVGLARLPERDRLWNLRLGRPTYPLCRPTHLPNRCGGLRLLESLSASADLFGRSASAVCGLDRLGDGLLLLALLHDLRNRIGRFRPLRRDADTVERVAESRRRVDDVGGGRIDLSGGGE